MAVKLFVLKPNEFVAYLCFMCSCACTHLSTWKRRWSRYPQCIWGFCFPKDRPQSLVVMKINAIQSWRQLTNIHEDHADVNHYKEKSLCVKREIALQFLYIWECCGWHTPRTPLKHIIMVIMMIILMVMMMTNTYLLSNIYTELGTFLSSSTVEIFPDIYFDKCNTFPNIMTSNNNY